VRAAPVNLRVLRPSVFHRVRQHQAGLRSKLRANARSSSLAKLPACDGNLIAGIDQDFGKGQSHAFVVISNDNMFGLGPWDALLELACAMGSRGFDGRFMLRAFG
jgi:hypothetical protein